MSDDIIEIKPGIGPIKLNMVALMRKLFAKSNSNPATETARRFLKLFVDHNVTLFQIQRFIPQLTPEKLKSIDSLLPELTSNVLESAANIFGVQLSWLEGADDRIYPPLSCYKEPHHFFEEYLALKQPDSGVSIKAFSVSKNLDAQKDNHQPLALVLVEKIINLSNDEITRYRVFMDSWDWSHSPCRIQIKAMVRKAFLTYKHPIPLYIVKPAELNEIIERKSIPHRFVKGCLLTNPSLEDFTLSKKEHAMAQETEELPRVLDYIDKYKLDNLTLYGSQ